MRITKKLKSLVQKEADNLRKYATQEELNKLDIYYLYPNSPRRCIYGMMTGYCYSDRATDLLNQCTKPYSSKIFIGEFYPSSSRKKLKPSSEAFLYGTARSGIAFSPIEVYISHMDAKSESLIQYLKGESETLEL